MNMITLDNYDTIEPANGTRSIGLYEGISNDDYHNSNGISSSQLKPALKSLYSYKQLISGNMPNEQTKHKLLGTAVHKLILEALDFQSDIAISRKFGRTKAEQEAKAEFYQDNAGKTIIDNEDHDKCRRMRDSVFRLPECEYIFADGQPELSGYYIDRSQNPLDSTNMLCRYRPDWRADWCIADVKSTVDVSKEAFRRTIEKFYYHVSAAHYLEGDRILKGTNHRQFIFLAVESEPPHEAAIYRLGQQSIEAGEILRREALKRIYAARDTGEWPMVNNGKPQEIDISDYALYKLRESKI